MHDPVIHPASFRDPSGFVFQWNDKYYRQVNKSYTDDYNLLMSSGLYGQLTASGALIAHDETDEIKANEQIWYKTLLPQQLKVITYPYEWCFSQLKDAALLTITILKKAVEYGMVIKDATPYNIQFINNKPVFIDTLSFEKYDENKAWVAYRQFCNMFLFPLYLEHYAKADIQKTLVVYPDGIPVNITSKLLPLKSRTSLGVWLHVYLQNTVSRNVNDGKQSATFNKKKLFNLADHLEATIRHMRTRTIMSTWNRYYDESISGNNYLQEKEKLFRTMLSDLQPASVLDIGANNGYFSKIMAELGFDVIAIDNDSASINTLYEQLKAEHAGNILPLIVDVANPSPATGFANKERPSFHQRVKSPVVVALALIHHLVVGRNIPLQKLAPWFAGIASQLLIEFVPREDEKVIQMLASRRDVFSDYTETTFEQEFSAYFNIKVRQMVPGSVRSIYLMEKR
jgi:hypothetical protein